MQKGVALLLCREISKLTFYSGKYIESVLVYVSLEESIWCYLLYCWHRVSVSFHFVKYMVWICPFHCTKYTYGLLSIYVMNCIYIILWQRKRETEKNQEDETEFADGCCCRLKSTVNASNAFKCDRLYKVHSRHSTEKSRATTNITTVALVSTMFSATAEDVWCVL